MAIHDLSLGSIAKVRAERNVSSNGDVWFTLVAIDRHGEKFDIHIHPHYGEKHAIVEWDLSAIAEREKTTHYEIINEKSGVSLGVYEADCPEGALQKLADDAGVEKLKDDLLVVPQIDA